MRKIAGIFTRMVREAECIDLKKVHAVRCVYESQEIQRVEITLTSSADESVIYSLNPDLAKELIEKMTYSYLAIRPRLKTRQED